MSERSYRLALGLIVLGITYWEYQPTYIAIIGVLLFEGLTNWRLTFVVSKLMKNVDDPSNITSEPSATRIRFDAERALRIIVAVMLLVSFIGFPQLLWFVPWIVGSFLALSGLVNFCPMVVALRSAGMR